MNRNCKIILQKANKNRYCNSLTVKKKRGFLFLRIPSLKRNQKNIHNNTERKGTGH